MLPQPKCLAISCCVAYASVTQLLQFEAELTKRLYKAVLIRTKYGKNSPHGFAMHNGKTRRGALVFDVTDLMKEFYYFTSVVAIV